MQCRIIRIHQCISPTVSHFVVNSHYLYVSQLSEFLMLYIRLKVAPGGSINPSTINSDCIENQFCQQRGIHNGNNTNPSYNTFRSTQNAMIMLQSTISRKGNTGANASQRGPGALPYCISTGNKLTKRRRYVQQ